MNKLTMTFISAFWLMACADSGVFAATLAPPANLRIGTGGGTPGAFPDASNTGVPAGVTLTPSGDITTSSNGQVIDAKDISGSVVIRHNNVTLKRSRVRDNSYQVVLINPGVTGTVIEDSEIDGMGASEVNGSVTMRRTKLHDFVGIVPDSNSVYQDNYIYKLAVNGGAHTECFRIQGGQNNVLIQHNTCDMAGSTAGTAFIFINAYYGSVSGVNIDNNQFLGGGAVGYGLYSTANPQIGMNTTNTSITNNLVSKCMYGYIYPAGSPSFTAIKTFSNNRDLATNAAIPTPSFIRVQ